MAVLSDQSVSIDFDVQFLEIADTRKLPENSSSAQPWSRVFVGPVAVGDNPQLRGKYTRQANGQQNIDVLLENVKIVAIPKIFITLYDNLMPLIPPLMDVLDRRAKIIAMTMTEKQIARANGNRHYIPHHLVAFTHDFNTEIQNSGVGFDISMEMPGLQLIFLDTDTTNETSRGFDATSNIVFKYGVARQTTQVSYFSKFIFVYSLSNSIHCSLQ